MQYSITAEGLRETTQDEEVYIFTREEMADVIHAHALPHALLQTGNDFGYARVDVYDGCDRLCLDMMDFSQKGGKSEGRVIILLLQGRLYCFTSAKERLLQRLNDATALREEKLTADRLLCLFLSLQTVQEELVFAKLEQEILQLEQLVLTDKRHDCRKEILHMSRRLVALKRYYEQMLNVWDILCENENEFFQEKTLQSCRRFYRQTERGLQNAIYLRESVSQVREAYEAEVDIALNSIMKVFTLVTTIFFPLTLIAGWYGMNFQMPEYGWKYGYLFAICLSVFSVIAVIAFFRKNKWL